MLKEKKKVSKKRKKGKVLIHRGVKCANGQWKGWNEEHLAADLVCCPTLKISAILRCCGSEQWFSMDRMTGMSDMTNADLLTASTTSCRAKTEDATWQQL